MFEAWGVLSSDLFSSSSSSWYTLSVSHARYSRDDKLSEFPFHLLISSFSLYFSFYCEGAVVVSWNYVVSPLSDRLSLRGDRLVSPLSESIDFLGENYNCRELKDSPFNQEDRS